MKRVKIGISSCLLGQNVRYDGGNKQNHYITVILGRYLDLHPVCPETGCGLPVPREAMRLIGDPTNPRLVTVETNIDMTDKMRNFCDKMVVRLEKEELCGFIFKKNSPSSGLHRVKVYGEHGATGYGRGLFADAVVRHFPLLPVEEEERLQDPEIREQFIERVFAYQRLLDLRGGKPGARHLVEFHTAHKLQVMAHSIPLYRELGRLVAAPARTGMDKLLGEYETLFMKALATTATVKKNTNVLMHIMGYFRKELSGEEKQELVEIIERYREHLLPLIVPVTLLRHYARVYKKEYLQKQVFLEPHPLEQMLRNLG